jgi:unsaturated chondroitin disaccharide hydrolase
MNLKMYKILVGIGFLLLISCSGKIKGNFANVALDYCAKQTNSSLKELKGDSTLNYSMMPRNILKGETKWNCRKATKEEWTSGFWPGVLWYDYEYTKDPKIKEAAVSYTNALAPIINSKVYDHDLGFLIFCSYGNAYRLTGNPAYKQTIFYAADSLATLYNPKVGTILSWPRAIKERGWPHNTIIDNMMNLEMLFWAAKNGENKELYDIAISHANHTMRNQFKPDYSCYHVALYDTITGKFIKGKTHQGYADNSMWARGQAWAIYGFTVCYRETKDIKYLDFVEKVANAYMKRLPKDYIPFWDFDGPGIPNAPRDASAAAVAASGLLELSTLVKGEKSELYLQAALHMLKTLSSSDYQSHDKNPAFLLHSTGHWPNKSEVDASIVYADYYYIEALLRLKRLNEGKKLIDD